MRLAVNTGLWLLLATVITPGLNASKLTGIKVLDQGYLIVHFKDGDVKFVDDGTGPTAFAGHASDPDNSYVVTYGEPLNTDISAETGLWKILSDDDPYYGPEGVSPVAVFRKTRVNGMSYTGWDPDISDHGFDYTKEHFIYLQLPSSMQQGSTYTVKIDQKLGSDVTETSVKYDIFNHVSEAVHVNLVGYMSSSRIKAADLYHFMGDGGNRDYSDFEGNEIFIFDVNSEDVHSVGRVAFWMESQTEANWNLTGSDVWTADFTGFNEPGTYRLVVEGVGASQDFEIRDDIYRVPYKVSILGYYYMRIGEDRMDMVPVPRRPLWIPNADPPDTEIIVTEMHPFHPEWRTFSSGDPWDRPVDWIPYIKEGRPTNPNAIGGHSDALDWDRHLAHVVNVYDLLLAYILSDGTLDNDDLRIAESGNGIPDILDEARNEVDFWLNLRYRGGYSHGLTNPDGNNRLYQAGNTAIAAWANALNSSMMSYCFQISGHDDLARAYRDSAIVAYNYAEASPDPMLDDRVEGIRGRDFKMMTAAYLYNITGDTRYEDILKNESIVTAPDSEIHRQRSHNQLWGAAAYLLTKQTVNYPDLFENMKSSIISEAKEKEADFVTKRPSRRGYAPEQAWWQTTQDMHRTIIAHAVTDNPDQKTTFLDALLLEAGWGLGRNPLNKIQMTTATTDLADKRSFENIYTSGRNDGTPGLHPGHTPYLNTESWGGHMVGSNPGIVFDRFYYPEIDNWPHAEKYINTRFIWTHSEFTPRQTMRGKALLYAYLYGLYKNDTDFNYDIDDKSRIDISSENPWYWQYNGKTILMLGGSWQDNLFNHPGGLEEHLDVLASVGGNYLRNTMSHRNVGNVFAYERNEEGLFDLNRFNPEYWGRFDNFVRLAFERDMIVQIELWDPADLYHDHQSFGGWSHHPFNPANNINYTSEESGLPKVIEYGAVPVPTEHPFFKSVPALDNNPKVLQYQQAYVDKLLSISLRYPNILYSMHNETGEKVEFGDYWADYFRQKAEEAGVIIHITDMRRGENVRSDDHAHIFDNPERYTFVDISQNNATLGYGQRHYDNIMFVRERLSTHPRPINNNKNYGPNRGGEETVSRMGRMIFAGSAGVRFHRPHPHEDPAYMYAESEWGLGLSPRAQKIIKSLRMATDELDIALTKPGNDLLSDREDNEAYLLAEPGRQYALYFPDGGSVVLDMSHASGQWNSRWINLDQAEWSVSRQIRAGQNVKIDAPGHGHWIVVLLPAP